MNDDTVFTWALIAGLALSAMAVRGVFLIPGARLRLPPTLERILRYAPASALMAIVVRDMTMMDGEMMLSPDNIRLIGGIVAFGIAIATRSVILTIAGGMLALTLARLSLG